MKLIAFLLMIFVLAMIHPVHAGEIYMWVDEKGVRHVTDKPPEQAVKIIGSGLSKPDSPEEIRRFRAEQGAYERDLEARQRYNQAETERRRFRESFIEQRKQDRQQMQEVLEKRKNEDTKYNDYQKAHSRAMENRDYNEARRLRFKYYQKK